MNPLTWKDIAGIMGWNAIVSESEANREPDGMAARVMRVADMAAELARQRYEDERRRHSIPASEGRRALIDALVGDALTGRKAADICERDGYVVTGVILSRESGEACLVNRQAVRWLSGERDLHGLMFPNHRPDPIAEAVAEEREACAKVCEALVSGVPDGDTDKDAIEACAAAIRARGAE